MIEQDILTQDERVTIYANVCSRCAFERTCKMGSSKGNPLDCSTVQRFYHSFVMGTLENIKGQMDTCPDAVEALSQ